MRVQRHKASRKALAFFRLIFGIHPPYRVLLDGNFLATALRLRMEWARLLPKLLHVVPALAHLHVTQCVMGELEALGEPAAEALALARTLPLLKCRAKHGHPDACTAAECARRLVGGANEGKWLVATQDGELRAELRRVPGVPLLLISTNVLILEPPSARSREAAEASEAGKSALSKAEAAAVKAAVKGGGGVAAAGGGAPAAAGGGGGGGGAPAQKAQRRKRKGPSEPNPLSQKKRKREPGGGAAPLPRAAPAAAAEHKPTRRKLAHGGGE
jgi:U3 small nucleolar RNA-associated protein 23